MSYKNSPDSMENLKLHQPAPPASNHIRHEALEAQYSFTSLEAQDPSSTRAKTVLVPCLHCGYCLKETGSARFFRHSITHVSTRRFRCSKCDTTNHTLAELKRHHIKCRGETIDDIDSKMIEEWSKLIEECYPQHSAKIHDYLKTKIFKISTPKTPKNTKSKKKRKEQREGSLEKYRKQFIDPRNGSNGMSDMETSESTAIPVEAMEISMPQLSLLRQDGIKDEDWNRKTVSLSNAPSTSTSEEQNSQLFLINQKLNDKNRLLREELQTLNRKMADMDRTLARKYMETGQLRDEKIASDAQFKALQDEILMLKAQLRTKGMNENVPCVQLD